VQADRGLTGPGAALHDQRAVGRQADQLVLLRRDRRDDLAHLADALARDVVDDRLGEVLLPGLQLLVDEPEHDALLDVEPAPAADAARVGRRGGVERLRGRRAPVDRQQPVALVGDRVPPDVQRPLPRPVDPPEVQRAAGAGVRAQALEPHPLEHLLGELVALAVAAADRERVEQRVVGGEGQVEVLLLLGELRIHGHQAHLAGSRRVSTRRIRVWTRLSRSRARTTIRRMDDVRARAEPLARSEVKLGDLALEFDETTAATVDVHVSGRDFFPLILEDIASATSSIHINQYGFRPGEIGERFAAALLAKAAEGVAVRIVVDRVGSRPGRSGGFYDRLRAGGIDVRVVRAPGRIDHRKLFVLDGRVAWVGGAGIEDHFNDGRFHDLFVRLTGRWSRSCSSCSSPASAGSAARSRRSSSTPSSRARARRHPGDRAAQRARLVPADHDRDRGAARRRARDARRRQPVRGRQGDDRAHHRRRAARRRVRLFVPASPNNRACAAAQRHHHPPCWTRGVRILGHPKMLHAKAFVRDGEEVLAGTCNLEAWSLKRFFEIDVRVRSREFAAQFDERFSAPAEAISTPGVAPDGIGPRFASRAAAAISPLL
jgi:cardiolipin synthase